MCVREHNFAVAYINRNDKESTLKTLTNLSVFVLFSFLSSVLYPILTTYLALPGGMKEQDLMCIKLHGVNRIGLKKIIDFIYTAKLSLNMENLQDTLEAASFLQILPVLDFCKVFLISGVRT